MNMIMSFSYRGEKAAVVEEFKRIAERESDKSKVLIEIIEEYVKNHSEGNPAFSLDKWQEDPTFTIVPTLFSDRDKWKLHYESLDEKEKTKMRIKINECMNLFKQVDLNSSRRDT